MPASQTFWFKNSLSSNRQWWFFKTLGIIQVLKLYNNNWVGVCIIYIYVYKYILGNCRFHLANRLGCFFKVPSETARSLREKFLLLRLQIYTTWVDRVLVSRCAVENHRLSSSVAEFTSVVWKCMYVYIVYILQSRLMILMFISTEEEAACKRKKISRRKDQKVMPPRFILETLWLSLFLDNIMEFLEKRMRCVPDVDLVFWKGGY